jgi:hypothetical protein
MTNDQRDPGAPPAGTRTTSWRRLMAIVLVAIVLMLLVKAFVVQVYRIPSASMEDTLLTGDRVLVMTTAPDDGTIRQSQVVGRAFLIMWPFSQFGNLPIPGTFQQPALGLAHQDSGATAWLRRCS